MSDRTQIISSIFERARAFRVCALSLCMITVVLCACCLVKDMFQMAMELTSAFIAKIAAAFNGRRFGLQAPKAIETSHKRFDGFLFTQGEQKPVKRCVFAKYKPFKSFALCQKQN